MLTNHGNSVRHLLLRDVMSFRVCWDYIHACKNLLTLGLVADDLTNNPHAPRGSTWSSFKTQCPNLFPVFQHLTHVELLTASSPLHQIGWLVSLPTLTHLLIFSRMTYINEVVKRIFKDCLTIRMVLWCPWSKKFRDEYGEPTRGQIQAIKFEELEPRLVICKISYVYFTDLFIAHAEGKSDSAWKLAEEIINKRL